MSCDGLWYRVEISHYLRSNPLGAFELRIKLLPLKRKTCPGCRECLALYKEIEEKGIWNAPFAEVGNWYKVERLHGKLFLIKNLERTKGTTGAWKKV